VDRELLVHHDNWVAKVHQLDDTVAVRHGIMVIGPAGGGTVALWNLWHCTDHNADRLVHLGMLHVYEPVLLILFFLYG